MKTLLLLFLLPIISSCQIGYLAKNSMHQTHLLFQRKNISEILDKKKASPQVLKKLELVQDVKLFCKEDLGLEIKKLYSGYVKLNREYLTYLVAAAKKNKLEAYTWWFPIVGTVPYKGFFEKKLAVNEKNKLKLKDLDTYLRGVSAFSTLGWFNDPIYSSMLNGSDDYLVNTIIHETIHANVYFKNQSAFNEQIASFFANIGTLLYYKKKYGINSDQVIHLENKYQDSLIFSDFIRIKILALKKWYEENQNNPNLSEERIQKFEDFKTTFTNDIKPKMKTKTYNYFENIKINNALLMQYSLYQSDYKLYLNLYESLNKNFKNSISYLKSIKNEKSAKTAIKIYVENKKQDFH